MVKFDDAALVAMMALIVVIIVVVIVAELRRSTRIGGFKNRAAIKAYKHLRTEHGQPFALVDKEGGFVVWREPHYFHEIVVKDDSTLVTRKGKDKADKTDKADKADDGEGNKRASKSDCEFVYVSIRVHLPENDRSAVLGLSESLRYDKPANILTAGSSSVEGAIATLKTAMDIAEHPESKKKDMYKALEDRVQNARSDESESRDISDALERMVRNNRQKYRDEVSSSRNGSKWCEMVQ